MELKRELPPCLGLVQGLSKVCLAKPGTGIQLAKETRFLRDSIQCSSARCCRRDELEGGAEDKRQAEATYSSLLKTYCLCLENGIREAECVLREALKWEQPSGVDVGECSTQSEHSARNLKFGKG
eukprot:4091018-Amphidinium_carterae.1